MCSVSQLPNTVTLRQKQPRSSYADNDINKWAWPCSNETLLMGTETWIYIMVTCVRNSILLLIFFFQSLKNIKTILSSRTIKKTVVGQIWPPGCSLLTPDPEPMCRVIQALWIVSHMSPRHPCRNKLESQGTRNFLRVIRLVSSRDDSSRWSDSMTHTPQCLPGLILCDCSYLEKITVAIFRERNPHTSLKDGTEIRAVAASHHRSVLSVLETSYKWNRTVYTLVVWLLLLNVTILKFTHIICMYTSCSFLWLNSISLYEYTTIYLAIYL